MNLTPTLARLVRAFATTRVSRRNVDLHHQKQIWCRSNTQLQRHRRLSTSPTLRIESKGKSIPTAADREKSIYLTSGGSRERDPELDTEAFAITLSSRPALNAAVQTNNFKHESIDLHEQSFDGRVPHNMVLTKTLYLSVDPFMRCRFNKDSGVEYTKSYQVGEPILSAGIGSVVAVGNSVSDQFSVGDLVMNPFDGWPWQTDALQITEQLIRIQQPLSVLIPITNLLGDVGLTGVTAFFGIHDFANVGEGDCVVISAAAGAVGLAAGQLAKARGATVIGICGSEAKQATLMAAGFDGTVNYKTSNSVYDDVMACITDSGHDAASVYFDNVGGDVSNHVFLTLGNDATVVLCGQISMYDSNETYPPPVSDEIQMLFEQRNISRERFLVLNYSSEFGNALAELCYLRTSNKLAGIETIYDGFCSAPDAFVSMMNGGNTGKAFVKCADEPVSLRITNGVRHAIPPVLRGMAFKAFVNPDWFSPEIR